MKWNADDNLFCADLPTKAQPEIGKILVSGASGYIGGRLVPELLARGYRVRVMLRDDSPGYRQRWPEAEIHVTDALNREQLRKTLEGVHTAYYLIHSMLLGKKKFETADIQAARNFRAAAEENNVSRIIYLGGLGDVNTRLSAHLRSRMHVAGELREGTAAVTVLRAAVIIGSGSASYEILKNLVKKLPVYLSPVWARTKCQPIAVRDVVKYLVGVLETPETKGKSYDIGGKEILTYQEMITIHAALMGKKKFFLPIPFSLSRLFAYLTSFFTPVPANITRCLMGGCKNEVICQNNDIEKVLPFQQLTYKEALRRAMIREEQNKMCTPRSDAYPPAHELAVKPNELPEPPTDSSSYSIPPK